MNASLLTGSAAGGFDAFVSGGDQTRITLLEAVDFNSVPGLRKCLLDLLEREPRRMIVDARGVFVDSSGIGALVHVAQRARQERRSFRLLCDQRLGEILRLQGLSDLLGLAEPTRARPPAQHTYHGQPLAA